MAKRREKIWMMGAVTIRAMNIESAFAGLFRGRGMRVDGSLGRGRELDWIGLVEKYGSRCCCGSQVRSQVVASSTERVPA
jgi:hypothetical protein